jgi:hypothetical protein
MPTENLNMDEINEARRQGIQASIRSISVPDLKKIGEDLFPFHDHPWRETFFDFIKENAGETFHHAVTKDGIHILYCHGKERGMWFLPGSGKGPLQPSGLKALKEIVERI